MSTLIDTENYSIVAPSQAFPMVNRPRSLDGEIGTPIFAQVFPVPLPQLAPETFLQMDFPDFHFRFAAPIVDFKSPGRSGEVTARIAIDAEVSLLLSLTGKLIEDGNKFQAEHVSLSMELADQKARADFIASTLWAMLTLAGESYFQIPEIGLDLKLNFELPLLEISKLLQTRQRDYRLMVIERATGKHFQLPADYSGIEMERIVFTYRAIVDRSFVWPFVPTKIHESATREILDQLPSKDNPIYESPATPVIKSVLGESISLGRGTLVIEDFFIPNDDEVRRELAVNDGHPVEFVVDSVSGQARYYMPEAPRLPDAPWDLEIQEFIDLESQLDDRLANRYHALAAATLADLTEEEKRELTARSRLDEGNRIFNLMLDIFEFLAERLQTFGHRLLILLKLRN